MRQGRLAPHVRRMRIEYARRRAAVLAALARHCPDISPIAAPGGLHLTLRLPDGADERRIVAAARERGLSLSPLGAYFNGAPTFPGLVAGFANTPTPLASDAARRLSSAVQQSRA
jgi:GntR family transcriptional regulator / MocR family aminotransferase